MSHEPKSLPKRLKTALLNEEEAHLKTVQEFDDFMFAVANLIRRLDQIEEVMLPYYGYLQAHNMPFGPMYQEEWETVVDMLMKQGYQPSELRGYRDE